MKRSKLLLGVAMVLCVRLVMADSAPTARSLIAQGDALFSKRADPQKSLEALRDYGQALAAEPQNVEALWKASRAAWWAGTLLEEKSERLAVFKKGKVYAEQAVALNPKSVEAQFWLGGNFSSYGHVHGPLSTLFALPTIRRAMKEVLKLDDRYMGGGAYRILGIIDYKLPGWAGGNDQQGLDYLQRSLSIDPQNPVTLYYIADYYGDNGKKDEARQWMKRFLDSAPGPDFRLEKNLLLKEEAKIIAKYS